MKIHALKALFWPWEMCSYQLWLSWYPCNVKDCIFMSQPLCKIQPVRHRCFTNHKQDNSGGKNASSNTFEKGIFTALCVVDPHDAFFISCCQNVLHIPSCKKKRKHCSYSVKTTASQRWQMQVDYLRRKPIQTVALYPPYSHRRCAHRVGRTGNCRAERSEECGGRDLQRELGGQTHKSVQRGKEQHIFIYILCFTAIL